MAVTPTVISIVGKFVDQATPGIDKLSNKIGGLGSSADSLGSKLLQVGRPIGVVTAGLAFIASQAVSAVKSLDSLAASAGLTAEAMQELQFVAQAAGVDASALTKGISSLSLEIGNGSNVSKAASNALDRLNIPIKELISLDAEGKFERVRSSLSGVISPTERAAIGTELLGAAYRNLAPLIDMTNEELAKAQVQLDAIGGPVGDDALKAVREIGGAWSSVAEAAKNAGIEIAAIISPAVVAGLDAVAAASGFLRVTFLGAGDEAAKLTKEIETLQGKAKFFENARDSSSQSRFREINREIERLIERQNRLLGIGTAGASPRMIKPSAIDISAPVNPALDAAVRQKEMQAAIDALGVTVSPSRRNVEGLPAGATGSERAADKFSEIIAQMQIDLEKGKASVEQYNARLKELYETIGLEEVVPRSKRMVEEVNKPLNEMTAAQERAAQSIQDAFVSAFSNIDQGIGGMVKGFLKAFAQILAQAAALDLAKALGIGEALSSGGKGGKSFLGQIVSTVFTSFAKRASGGLVSGAAIVGEDGPELLLSGGTSMVMNRRQLAFGGGGGAMAYSPTTNIIVQGDVNRESEGRLLAYIESTRSKDQREMMRMLERNGMRNIR